MNQYRHHVSGFFAHREKAESTSSLLIERGLPREQVYVFGIDAEPAESEQDADSKKTLKNLLVDSAIGTAIGTGVGALVEVTLVVANVSLFIASPLLAPIMLLGWGASVGALIGATTGAASSPEHKEGKLSELIGDAISTGQFVLVAETRTEQETIIASEVMKLAVGDYNDISTA